MATIGRTHAEQLVGPLDRSGYAKQKDVANQAFNTNWESLQNQYANLTEQLKKNQEQSNQDFAEGLTSVASNSYDRLRNANENMATSGLSASGLNDLIKQNDITQKGAEVAALLDKQGDVSVETAGQLKSGNEQISQQRNNLVSQLSDTLGQIGAQDTAAQMSYNTGLAGIAEGKEARDMENELAAMQRAANERAAASSGGTSKEDEDLEEAYRRQAITAMLSNTNPETGESLGYDATQRANSLKILLGVDNANNIVNAFDSNVSFGDQKSKISSRIDELQGQLDDLGPLPTYQQNAYGIQTSYPRTNTNDYLVADSLKYSMDNLRNEMSNMSLEELAKMLYG